VIIARLSKESRTVENLRESMVLVIKFSCSQIAYGKYQSYILSDKRLSGQGVGKALAKLQTEVKENSNGTLIVL
jgi:hypothetical protein